MEKRGCKKCVFGGKLVSFGSWGLFQHLIKGLSALSTAELIMETAKMSV
jgi:hypothetical protein